MKIVFATNNVHKLQEIRAILGEGFEVLSLADIGCHEDIPETGNTFQENALQKAEYVYRKYGFDCFADDSGLEVKALGGAPGVYSARYANMENPEKASHDADANMDRLMRELEGKESRQAQFRTVIAYVHAHEGLHCVERINFFEGIVSGEIIRERRGGEGFGYDPIFQPDGYDQTFAELGTEVKNQISHRARATQKLADYLLK